MKIVQHSERLERVHPSLVKLVDEVAKTFSVLVICGERTKTEQDAAYNAGTSQVKWPNSKHNIVPPENHSRAVDIAPIPLDWNDKERFYYFAGYVKAKAQALGLNLIWGGDFDDDGDLHDQTLYDLVHFEIIE